MAEPQQPLTPLQITRLVAPQYDQTFARLASLTPGDRKNNSFYDRYQEDAEAQIATALSATRTHYQVLRVGYACHFDAGRHHLCHQVHKFYTEEPHVIGMAHLLTHSSARVRVLVADDWGEYRNQNVTDLVAIVAPIIQAHQQDEEVIYLVLYITTNAAIAVLDGRGNIINI